MKGVERKGEQETRKGQQEQDKNRTWHEMREGALGTLTALHGMKGKGEDRGQRRTHE